MARTTTTPAAPWHADAKRDERDENSGERNPNQITNRIAGATSMALFLK